MLTPKEKIDIVAEALRSMQPLIKALEDRVAALEGANSKAATRRKAAEGVDDK